MGLLRDGFQAGVWFFGAVMGFGLLACAALCLRKLFCAALDNFLGDEPEEDSGDESEDGLEETEMNKVFLIGNLANTPEYSVTQNGIEKCTFRLAVQRRFANQQGVREADFLQIVCWRQTAENVRKYLDKGSRCAVEGTIQTRSYDAQDGMKRYVTEIIADSVEFLTPRTER